MEFGDRLRRLRTGQGLTVRGLAERVGVSPSYISQLENKECSPSFSVLKKIAEVLGTTVSTLTEDKLPEEWMVVRRETRRKLVVDIPGCEVDFLAFTGSRDKRMQSCIVRLQPGVEGPNRVFLHDREDFFYVLQGNLIISSGSKEYVLSDGDAAYFNFHRPEIFKNPGPGVTVFLWTVSPAC
ncbi:MAG TPA: helix-turn-helix domain-containing protein [Firmicutes bacterium]|nr:helix-turn-helix domain-containing protein [Bacillota bacterium]